MEVFNVLYVLFHFMTIDLIPSISHCLCLSLSLPLSLFLSFLCFSVSRSQFSLFFCLPVYIIYFSVSLPHLPPFSILPPPFLSVLASDNVHTSSLLKVMQHRQFYNLIPDQVYMIYCVILCFIENQLVS